MFCSAYGCGYVNTLATLWLYLYRCLQLREKIRGAYEALTKGTFIIASTLIILIALRNSLIW